MAKHRAEQITDSVVAILNAAGIKAESARFLSYDPQMELPAVSVRMGTDTPAEPPVIPVFDSVLTVIIVMIVRAATEPEVQSALLKLRADVHIALMADSTLALGAFVIDTDYGGASAPEIEPVAEGIAGRLETPWLVKYRMNLADPT